MKPGMCEEEISVQLWVQCDFEAREMYDPCKRKSSRNCGKMTHLFRSFSGGNLSG
jgi:hypothetical protein